MLTARYGIQWAASCARCRPLHTTAIRSNTPTKLHNILSGGPAPPVQIKRITGVGIELADGLILPAACIFLEGQIFLWDVPPTLTSSWGKDKFHVFELVVPKPEILLFGTGKTTVLPPPSIRTYLNSVGIQVDVMDTWNACTTYNLLAEEGRRVAAALLPTSPRSWRKDGDVVT
ncbi:DUF498-domain-containing protein [Rickenella mellea]|uniref:DUF498-domain-containing protein n=1 Tax=Rickenella mellea TaxID=50990 RepID=A0A4R5XFI8_9AGAM|nr:DUF498-domain-containing protein [Rickenella mellea]